MKYATAIKLKTLGIILSTGLTLVVLAYVSSKYLIGFGWNVVFDRFWFSIIVFAVALVLGVLLIMVRLRPWDKYYEAKEQGQPVDPELAAKTFELAYGFPVSTFLILVILVIGGAFFLSADLVTHWRVSWSQALLVFPPSLIYIMIAGVIIFYLLKRLFNPILLDVAADHPEILLGRFDRGFHFPLISRPVRIFLPVRFKLFMAMFLLGLSGVVFFAMAVQQLGVSAQAMAPGSEAGAKISSLRSMFLFLMMAQVAFSLVISFVLSFLAARDISLPIREIMRAAEAIEAGGRKDRARMVTEDEVGEVGAAVNRMAEELVAGLEAELARLEKILQARVTVSGDIRGVSQSMLAIMADLAAESTEQRLAIEESSANSHQLGETARTIASHSRQIETLSTKSLNACENGAMTVQQMVNTMDLLKQRIHKSADEMTELLEMALMVRGVVELIKEISDQVNLLSFNTALEAAGAGEAGRRFNVVAEEINKLAERTLSSTGHISRLIEEIITAADSVADFAEAGKSSVDQAVESMEQVGIFLVDLLGQVEDVSQQVLAISRSTEQQTKSSMLLAERLKSIENSAIKVEANISEVETSLHELQNISQEELDK